LPQDEGVTIALAGHDDVPAMLALSNDAAARSPANFATEPEALEDWDERFEATESTYPWLVARDGENVLGFARASPHRARGAYRWRAEVSVYVDPTAWRRGIARLLYEALLGTLRAQRYVTLHAGITLPNPASQRLHESFGFERCGTFRRAGWKFGAWHDVGYWELALRAGGEPPRPIRPVREVWVALDLGEESIASPAARALIERTNAELSATYPEPGATHFRLEEDEIGPGRGAFLVARIGEEPVACGAVRLIDETTAEIKRMYVARQCRGRGVAGRVLAALEFHARALGAGRVVLETGARQKDALALYGSFGYAVIPPFGEYIGAPLSVCMEKHLALASGSRTGDAG
jgi:phosphinothricin acetyltransferase